MSDFMIVPGRGRVRKETSFCGMTIYSSNNKNKKPVSAYERTKAEVYATGNKWAIENFHATHDWKK